MGDYVSRSVQVSGGPSEADRVSGVRFQVSDISPEAHQGIKAENAET